jgi:hypothetical protein
VSVMRAWVRALGLLGPLCGCFVDPGNATVGGASVGGSTGAATSTGGTTEVSGATSSSGGGPEPTSSGTTAAGSSSSGGTTGAVVASTGSEGTQTGSGESSSGDASSSGGVELPVPGCEPLFFTDFSTDPQELLQLIGEWTWDQKLGTVTVKTQAEESSMAITEGSWQDALVYTRVRVSSGYGVVRMRSAKQIFEWSNYFGSMQPSTDKVQLGRNISGNGTVFQNPTFPTDPGVWYTMTLAVQGNDLSFGIDDKVLTATKDGMLAEGQASIGGFGVGVAEFDWFLVCVAD